ncbi:MAG: beta-mannosidase [Gordonia sp. (in: high G+C Gram-positive bacteria)]|uniref:beta-mannosidase n=1 Tax=Gordonia TaxID=2053 RepID=UPI0032666CF8
MASPARRALHVPVPGVSVLRLLAVLLIALVLGPATACAASSSVPDRAAGRVSASAAGLMLDHRPWWPTGFDAYQLATDWSVNVGCGAQVDLDRYFGALPPRSLTRFNLFAALAVDKATGLPDYRAVDAVFGAAARHHQLLLPVLTGGEGPCEDEQFKDRDWYRSGWRTAKTGPHGTFAQWVDTAVRRWRNEPSLAGWEPVGEPEPGDCTRAGCTWPERTCAPDAAQVLRTFFDDVGGRIHRTAPGSLVFTGTAGGDQCGTVGDGYLLLARSPGVDVLDFHDYPDESGTPAEIDTLTGRLAQARQAGKPLLVGELGIKAGACLSTTARADRFAARLRAHRADGVAGALLWAFVPDPRTTECTYDIGPQDPAWQSLARP